MVEVALNKRWYIKVPKHRAAFQQYQKLDGWEGARLNKLHEVIKDQISWNRTPKVYYIGAEEGEMPALCKMWGANVLMIEPNERVLPNIKAIWDANGLDYQEFVAGFAGNEATAKPDWEKATSKLSKVQGEVIDDHGFKELHDPGEIPVYKIDDFVPAGFISPTIIAMDVEGSEFEVLKGAKGTIETFRPDIFLSLHPEFLIQYWGVYASEVRTWVKALGYSEELLDYQHEVHLHYRPL